MIIYWQPCQAGFVTLFYCIFLYIYLSIFHRFGQKLGTPFPGGRSRGRSKISLFPLSKTSPNLSLFFLLLLEWGRGHLHPHSPILYPWPLWGWVGTGPLADDVVNGIVSCSDGKTQWDLGWGELSMGSLVWGSPYITFRSPYMAFRIPHSILIVPV